MGLFHGCCKICDIPIYLIYNDVDKTLFKGNYICDNCGNINTFKDVMNSFGGNTSYHQERRHIYLRKIKIDKLLNK